MEAVGASSILEREAERGQALPNDIRSTSDMQQLHDWLERKLRAPLRRLREPMKATEEFRPHTGPRYLFGKVTLSATPAAVFGYTSHVRWPTAEQTQLFEDCVLDGILDVLVIEQTYAVLGVALVGALP